MRRMWRIGAAAGVMAALLLADATGGGTAPAGPPEDRRVVVIAVPGLTWKDIDAPELPQLRALLDESAVANVATRVTSVVAAPGDAYLTLGTGTRAVAPKDVAGQSFQAEELFGPGTAAQEHARQHGATSDADVLSLGWTLVADANDDSEFGGTIGALGDVLDGRGIQRGVVANADGADPLVPGEPIHREAVLALADSSGTVPCGQVGAQLLAPDDSAPFGVRLEPDTVLSAFDRCSEPGSVVLVEASDLRRALSFQPRATAALADAAHRAALASTDDLVGRLVAQLDPERDVIVVVAPSTQPDPGLGVLGIRAPELEPGLLTSGNTRRPGYVLLTDVAPSIARLVGAEMDESSIEGRAVERRDGPSSGADRREQLVTGESAAQFRDRILDSVVLAVVVAVSALALVAAAAAVRGWSRGLRWIELASLVLLALPSMTYLAALLPFHDWGPAAYWAFLVLGSAAAGGAAWALRTAWLRPLVLVYGLLVGVVTLSVVVLGSRLQVATVFGDSPIIAGRFTGINNVTFAFFVLAGCVLACIAVDRIPGDRGRWAMLAILGAVLVIDVAPMWGADVGGALAGLPALVLLATGLGRWRVRWRTVALVAVGTLVLVGGLGWLDLTRDSADRSHLGRLFERIGSDGSSGLTTVVERKLAANLRSLTESTWRYVFGPLAIAAALYVWRGRDRAAAVGRAFPALRWALPGFVVLAVLGYGANDSGIAVPAAMLASGVPGLVYLACRVQSGEDAPA